jgi:hypothetical protein
VFIVAREELVELINQTNLPPSASQLYQMAEQQVQSRIEAPATYKVQARATP